VQAVLVLISRSYQRLDSQTSAVRHSVKQKRLYNLMCCLIPHASQAPAMRVEPISALGQSGHFAAQSSCPLYSRKRALSDTDCISRLWTNRGWILQVLRDSPRWQFPRTIRDASGRCRPPIARLDSQFPYESKPLLFVALLCPSDALKCPL
jgi:hypothetical protein